MVLLSSIARKRYNAAMTNTDPQPKSGLIWERLQQAESGARLALSRAQIVRAAMTIADAEGAQAISMRRIAAELGSTAMALYRHVFSKDDLLDLMLDAVFEEIALPEQPTGDWRTDLRAFAYTSRRVFKQHPWVLPLLISRPTLGPNYLRWFEFSLACVANHGLDIATMTQIVGVLNGYTSATVSYEVAEDDHTRQIGLSEADKRAIVTPYIQRIIASGRYPNFARFFAEEVSPDPEQSFAFGIECVLDGIAAQLTQRSAT
jgi:AcrR family transcriptional regulator